MNLNPTEKKKIETLLRADLSTLPKVEINAMRKELLAIIKCWWITPVHELRFLGLFSMFQQMLDKEKEMLQALKK